MDRIASALITGASSGIGRALAEALAKPGVVLHLSGRDQDRLATVAAHCRTRGAKVVAQVLDVRDQAAMAAWIRDAGRLDLVIANAGITAGTLASLTSPQESARSGEDEGAVRAIFATNLDGALNTVLPAWQVMRMQARSQDGVRGRIAVIASIAAFIASPDAPSYCAAKAAIDRWTVANVRAAEAEGIGLTSVCPGYIRSPMTDQNDFPMPGLMDADQAAAIILRGIAAGRARIVFPWWIGAAARLAALLPPGMLGLVLPRRRGRAAARAH
jgi:NAD(P)-dependent dehydrogenase (short-subunit alcohol dehydrogenase family)